MNENREFDLIVWGATGFTGRLVAEYLFKTYSANSANSANSADGSIKWAMGGRNQAKLAEVRAAVADATIPLVIADSQDEESLNIIATLADGSTAVGKVTGDMDPGYGSTSKIIAESAICLAKDEIPDGGGVLTPSIAMGHALLTRLQANAGLTFSYG